jgi:signal transduction histidine kinase
MLHQFVAANRDEIIKRCRAKVEQRTVPPPTAGEIDSGVPLFLDRLGDALRSGRIASFDLNNSAAPDGQAPLLQGFTVSQVVHGYGDLCRSITELAVEMDAPISTDDVRTLNGCLDAAIADAVTWYGRGQNQSILDEAARTSQRLAFLTHELRNLTHTAILAFEILKMGNVGFDGSTGYVLHRSLIGLRSLMNRSLGEVRLTEGVQNLEQFLVSGFIDELAPAARLEANARKVSLILPPVEGGLVIEADQQILALVVGNVLQNAFKFTRPRTNVTLRVGASAERVLIEIEDECGGLPGGDVEELFRPFEQRSTDRTGLGLGLAFSRWGVEANNGRIYARDVPDQGCVFTVDLPRPRATPNFKST